MSNNPFSICSGRAYPNAVASNQEQTVHRFFETSAADGPISLREGGSLPQIQVAYQTWGTVEYKRPNYAPKGWFKGRDKKADNFKVMQHGQVF